jgi:uncharacterized alpha-E superfamily protein
MLSRVADALFWMSRYLERADATARLLDVCFHLELDLHGLSAAPYELHWTALASILQQRLPASVGGPSGTPQSALSHWLTFETDNPDSIASCVARARLNARSIRGAINSEMWRELNKMYWKLTDPTFSAGARESPYEFYQAVECGAALFQGFCDASSRDEGWQFIQLGRFLERMDKILRILDVQYHLLNDLAWAADAPLSNLHWAGVLRSCRAYEAYQRLHVGRIDPERVAELLLLRPEFPRSVRFCLEQAASALAEIEGTVSGRPLNQADRLLGMMLADLKYRDLAQILAGDLHDFLCGLLERGAQISLAVQERYSLH